MVRRGLPVRPDGKVDREVAVKWIADNNLPHRGGWGMGLRQNDHTRHDVQDTTQIPVPPEGTARELFEVLVSNAVRIPEILIAAGLRDIDLVQVATEQFVEFVYVLSGDMDRECFPDYDSPGIPNTVDYGALAAKYALAPPNADRVDKFFEVIDTVIYPDLKKDIEKCLSAKDNR